MNLKELKNEIKALKGRCLMESLVVLDEKDYQNKLPKEQGREETVQ